MKNYNILISILALMALIGCKQNPYTGAAKPGQKIVSSNPDTHHETPKVFSIEAPDNIDCLESANCEAGIIGHVPAPGQAILSFKGLPAGASYDATTKLLSYKPGFEVVDVAKHPEQSMVKMNIVVTVRSTADSITESTHAITMTVENKMQPIVINLANSVTVNEGETLEQVVEVLSPDFPQGPFNLTVSNAPTGTEIKAVTGNPNQFAVKFTPSFFFVKNSTFTSLTPTFTASLPLGQSASKAVSWRVDDVRQTPAIAAPETITQGLDVGFSIRAEDMNGEVTPQINIMNTVPFGRLALTTVLETQGTDLSVPSKMVLVRWDQLKTSNFGTTTPIAYEVCVKKNTNSKALCTAKQVMVTLKGDVHPAPTLDRSFWKIGDLKFIRAGVPMAFKMPILDSEDVNLPVAVVADASQPGTVTWENGILTVNPRVEGILQFNLVAESVFGQKVTESFVMDVFPTSWAKTILLTSEIAQTESVETAKLISSVEMLTVKFQVSARSTALRDSCLLTTEALGAAKVDEALQNELYQKLQFTVVSSPLAGNLKGKIVEDLKAFGVKIAGRLSSISKTDIGSVTLAVDSKSMLESPKVPAGLNGTLTIESKDPLVFDLSAATSKCAPLFNLQKPGLSVPVGVSCRGADGKVLSVLGFELSDVLLDKKDQPLLEKWTNVLLKGEAI